MRRSLIATVTALGACALAGCVPAAVSTTPPATTTGAGPTVSAKPAKATKKPVSTTAPTTTAPTTVARWSPGPGLTWQYQLSGKVDTTVDADAFDIDGFDNSSAVVAAIHAQGAKAICYINAAAWENWRPDKGSFPASVKGNDLDGWPGEQWLDVRELEILEPLMAARFDLCQEKGFDAVEPDNVDGYSNDTGFPITAKQQLAYNTMLADLAHDRGLAVALKNDVDQVASLAESFDFAVNEECVAYSECNRMKPFLSAGKAVFHVEYEGAPSAFCSATTTLGLSSIRKKLGLDAWRQSC